MRQVQYTDDDGIERIALLPDAGGDPRMGIPHSLDVDSLFDGTSVAFRRRLYKELWARGLVTKADYQQRDAPQRVKSALQSAIKQDVFSIMSLARG